MVYYKNMPNQIKITCSTGDYLPLEKLSQFQGKFKFREADDIAKVKKSILRFGFSFPFFVWKCDKTNYILDGHGREIALRELREAGYEIPNLPVVYIQAENQQDAKEKLLRINSRFGDITNSSFVNFAKGLNLDFKSIDIRFEKELSKIEPVKVSPPKPIETTIPHVPTFETATPSENAIKDFEEKNLHKFENVVKDRNERMCSVTCPCCGKTMLMERNAIFVKISQGY